MGLRDFQFQSQQTKMGGNQLIGVSKTEEKKKEEKNLETKIKKLIG